MKTKLTMTLLVLFCLGTVAAMAQVIGTDLVRLNTALDRTDEIIQRAKDAVSESGSERAQNLLEMALRLQKLARDITGTIDNNNLEVYALRAGQCTINAREKAQRAIAVTRQAEENDDYVRGRLERTDDLIRRVGEKVGDSLPRGLSLLLDTSREKQERALELYRNRRLRAALQLTLQTERTLKEAASQAGSLFKSERRYQSHVDRYFTLWEQIEPTERSDQPGMPAQLDRAEQLKRQAEEFAAKNEYGEAEETMLKAVEILSLVAEGLREPGKIKSAIDDLQQQADRLEERLAAKSDRELQNQYQNAREHLQKAAVSYKRGELDDAAAHLQAARQVLTRIEQMLGD